MLRAIALLFFCSPVFIASAHAQGGVTPERSASASHVEAARLEASIASQQAEVDRLIHNTGLISPPNFRNSGSRYSSNPDDIEKFIAFQKLQIEHIDSNQLLSRARQIDGVRKRISELRGLPIPSLRAEKVQRQRSYYTNEIAAANARLAELEDAANNEQREAAQAAAAENVAEAEIEKLSAANRQARLAAKAKDDAFWANVPSESAVSEDDFWAGASKTKTTSEDDFWGEGAATSGRQASATAFEISQNSDGLRGVTSSDGQILIPFRDWEILRYEDGIAQVSFKDEQNSKPLNCRSAGGSITVQVEGVVDATGSFVIAPKKTARGNVYSYESSPRIVIDSCPRGGCSRADLDARYARRAREARRDSIARQEGVRACEAVLRRELESLRRAGYKIERE